MAEPGARLGFFVLGFLGAVVERAASLGLEPALTLAFDSEVFPFGAFAFGDVSPPRLLFSNGSEPDSARLAI